MEEFSVIDSNMRIEGKGKGRSVQSFVLSVVKKWRGSNRKIDMINAGLYYSCKNKEISDKKRGYISSNNVFVQNKEVSNTQIISNFYRKLVDQKVDYGFSKPFLINIDKKQQYSLKKIGNYDENAEDEAVIAKSRFYLSKWNEWLSPKRRKVIRRIVRDAICKGICPAFLYLSNEKDEGLEITYELPEETYPYWVDRCHDKLNSVIRDYYIQVYDEKNDTDIIVNKIELWNEKGVIRFIYDSNGKLKLDNANSNEIDAHMYINDDDEKQGIGWGRVPFVFLKGNDDEIPALNFVKSYIDAYDNLQSASIDSLLDDIAPTIVLEGYTPDVEQLERARQIIKQSRILATSENGRAYYLQAKADMTATSEKLENIKKDIREFSRSVDTQDIKFGSNPSGIALKSYYQDLDTDINNFELNFKAFMDEIKYFFDIYLEFSGFGTAQEWSEYELNITLDRDMMINETELVGNLIKMASIGELSQETLDTMNPYVESHEIEQARRAKEADMTNEDIEFNKKIDELLKKEKEKEDENKDELE